MNTNNDSSAQVAYDNDTYYTSSDIIPNQDSKKRSTSIKDKII